MDAKRITGNHVIASLIIHEQLMIFTYFSLVLSNLKLRSSLKHMVVIKLTKIFVAKHALHWC